MRAAIFFTLAPDHPLSKAAAAWLMRDAFTGAVLEAPDDPVLSREQRQNITADPRRYGFHATLKAPFRLAPGVALEDLVEAVGDFAGRSDALRIASLRLERLGSFFALTPQQPAPAVDTFAADIVRHFDRFRAPLTKEEIARRKPERLTPSERQNLERWGYPYVMDAFRFHMSLTGPVAPDDQAPVAAVLRDQFAPFLGRPLEIDALAVFVEPEPGADFYVAARCPCGGDGFVPMFP